MSQCTTTIEVSKTPAERVREVMRGVRSSYLVSQRDDRLKAAIEYLVEDAQEGELVRTMNGQRAVGRNAEGRALVLIGESGAGKTRAFQRAMTKTPEFMPDDEGESRVVSVTAPSPCTLRLLGKSLLCKLGYAPVRDLKENVVWEMSRRHLQLRQVRYVHFDEVQHATQTESPQEVKKVQNTLKGLMQCSQWPVSLILSGLPEIELLIKGDPQLFRRSRFVRFPTLTFNEDASKIKTLAGKLIQKKAGLGASLLTKEDFISRLIHAAMGQMGILIEFIQDAICEALREGSDTLKIEHFGAVYEARTACDPQENVFTCSGDWMLVDIAAVPGSNLEFSSQRSQKRSGK